MMEVKPATLLAYLRALLWDISFREWQDCYVRTEVIDHPLSEQEQADARRLKLPPETVATNSQRVERLDVLEGLRKYVAKQHVLLVGRPGSGKSTSLKRLVWEEAQKAQAELEQLVREKTEEDLADLQVHIPVLVRLRSCNATTTVESVILQFLSGHNFRINEAQLEKLLLQGRFLLLLDGLNELPKDTRNAVDQFREQYRRTTPMIFTTRDLGVGQGLGIEIEKVLKMMELTDSQIRKFVQAHLAHLGEQAADEMLRQLSSERLRKFAEIPLLLWMLCRVFAQEKGKLPENLGAAFREFAQIYDREIKADVLHQDCQSWGAEVLQQLAFAMMPQQSPTGLRLELPNHEAEEILTRFLENKKFEKLHDAKGWLQVLQAHHLIQPATASTIEFRHQLLQEYYAAEYLLRQIPHLLKDKHSKEYLKHYYLNYTDWTESIALMLALPELKEEDAVQVVQLARDVDLKLCARLAGAVKPKLQKQTVSLVTQEVSQQVKIRLLGITRSDEAIPILQLDLNETYKIFDYSYRVAHAVASGESESDAAIKAYFPTLCKGWDEASATRSNVAYALGEIGSTEAVELLLKALKHEEDFMVRGDIIAALGNTRNESARDTLIQALHNPDSNIREKAAEALGKFGGEDVVSALIARLGDEDARGVRWSVADALGAIGITLAIPALIHTALHDEDLGVRRTATQGLKKIDVKTSAFLLAEALKEKAPHIRENAAQALGELGAKEVVPNLSQALQDKNSNVRYSIVIALGAIGSKDAIYVLSKTVRDDNLSIRLGSILSLGKIGKEAIPALVQVLQDEIFEIHCKVVEALSEIDSKDVIPILAKILDEDVDYWVCVFAAHALEKKSNNSNSEEEIHRELEESLNRISGPDELPGLFELLKRPSESEQILEVISSIQERCKFYNYNIAQSPLFAVRN